MRQVVGFRIYIAILVINCLFNFLVYENCNSRLGSFLILGAVPAFSSESQVGDRRCDNPFLCGHYVCSTGERYTMLSNHTSCDITFDSMISRYNSASYVYFFSDILFWSVIAYAILGSSLLAMLSLTITYKGVAKLSEVLLVSCPVIIADIIVKMLSIYVIVQVTYIRPYVPNFYQISDDRIMIWSIVTVCAVLIVFVVIIIQLTIDMINDTTDMMFSRVNNVVEDDDEDETE